MAAEEIASLTNISEARWSSQSPRFRQWEKTGELGRGDDLWEWATTETLRWGVKTRSGFSVSPASSVSLGDRPVIRAHVLGFTIPEPVEVVDVI